MANKWVKSGSTVRFYFLGLQNHCRWWLQPRNLKKRLLLGRKAITNLESVLKSKDLTLLTKSGYSQSYGFSSSHVWMWELDHKEDWPLKGWCFWTVVLEKTLESPLDCKEKDMLKLKLQYFGHLMQRADSLEKKNIFPWCWERLREVGEGDNRGWDGWMASPTQ